MITTKNDSVRLYGLSTDSKPVDGVINGTIFVEIDTSDEYYFNEDAGTWVKKNSSVGGGLPTPTAADNGKAVVVSVTATEGAVIVPEQTVTLTEVTPGAPNIMPVQNANASLFTAGAEVIATVDDVDYSATVDPSGQVVYLDEWEDFGFGVIDGEVFFLDNSMEIGNTAVVKLCLVVNNISYGFGGGALKVSASGNLKIDDVSGDPYFDAGTTLDVSYADVEDAIASGRPVFLAAEIDAGEGSTSVIILGVYGYAHFDGGGYAVSFLYDDSVVRMIIEFTAVTETDALAY